MRSQAKCLSLVSSQSLGTSKPTLHARCQCRGGFSRLVSVFIELVLSIVAIVLSLIACFFIAATLPHPRRTWFSAGILGRRRLFSFTFRRGPYLESRPMVRTHEDAGEKALEVLMSAQRLGRRTAHRATRPLVLFHAEPDSSQRDVYDRGKRPLARCGCPHGYAPLGGLRPALLGRSVSLQLAPRQALFCSP